MYKTLILLDYDDTLFPTSWLVKNSIDLSNKSSQNRYIVFFSKLDMILYHLLSKLIKLGQVVIVTNASARWVTSSSEMIPNTQKILKNKTFIVSARDSYKKQYPTEMNIWKKKMFEDLVTKYYGDHEEKNIISVGDAEYELDATINLYDESSAKQQKLLKTVKLMKEPSFDQLIDQLEVLNSSAPDIVNSMKHLDLKFHSKK